MCLSGCRRCNCRLRGKRCSGSTDARQINLECRSLAGLAVNPNEAFALLNNSVDGREAKASAFRSLRCKEGRSEEHTSELQSHSDLVCRLLLEKKKKDETKA